MGSGCEETDIALDTLFQAHLKQQHERRKEFFQNQQRLALIQGTFFLQEGFKKCFFFSLKSIGLPELARDMQHTFFFFFLIHFFDTFVHRFFWRERIDF